MAQTYSTINIFSALTATVATSKLGSNFAILNKNNFFELNFYFLVENKILNEFKLVIPYAASGMLAPLKCHFSIAFNAVNLQHD